MHGDPTRQSKRKGSSKFRLPIVPAAKPRKRRHLRSGSYHCLQADAAISRARLIPDKRKVRVRCNIVESIGDKLTVIPDALFRAIASDLITASSFELDRRLDAATAIEISHNRWKEVSDDWYSTRRSIADNLYYRAASIPRIISIFFSSTNNNLPRVKRVTGRVY